VNPEIRRYLDEHGEQYTTDALRQQLTALGLDPLEVIAALREWEEERAKAQARPATAASDVRTFRRWALWLHIGALVAMVVLVVGLNGTAALGLALIGAVVLGLFLAVGWVVSTFIGRALLPRAGLTVALVAPVISALVLGGTCLAIMEAATPTRPRLGVVELQIGPPWDFDGSGSADCFIESGRTSFSIYAENLGTLDGWVVSVSINSYTPPDDPNAPAPAPASGEESGTSMFIAFNPTSESIPAISYTSSVDSEIDLETSAAADSGAITFAGLAPEAETDPNALPSPGPISGTLTWTCE
jgi:hypothetical protein